MKVTDNINSGTRSGDAAQQNHNPALNAQIAIQKFALRELASFPASVIAATVRSQLEMLRYYSPIIAGKIQNGTASVEELRWAAVQLDFTANLLSALARRLGDPSHN
jgi:hypothetical protein